MEKVDQIGFKHLVLDISLYILSMNLVLRDSSFIVKIKWLSYFFNT